MIGVLHRNVSKLSPEELDKLHQKVITQRSNLPEFQYSLLKNEDNDGYETTRKELIRLPDGS